MRFFARKDAVTRDQLPDPRLQIFFGLLLGATVFGSLWAIADEGGSIAATLITTGIAISVLPILMRGLPSLARDAATRDRDPNYRARLRSDRFLENVRRRGLEVGLAS